MRVPQSEKPSTRVSCKLTHDQAQCRCSSANTRVSVAEKVGDNYEKRVTFAPEVDQLCALAEQRGSATGV